MKFEGQLDGRELMPRPPRIDTGFTVLVRSAAGAFEASMTNLSAGGFRLSAARSFEVGAEVSLEVPKLPPVKCLICWAVGNDAGGVFLESIAL
jgi:hypothetical protein